MNEEKRITGERGVTYVDKIKSSLMEEIKYVKIYLKFPGNHWFYFEFDKAIDILNILKVTLMHIFFLISFEVGLEKRSGASTKN